VSGQNILSEIVVNQEKMNLPEQKVETISLKAFEIWKKVDCLMPSCTVDLFDTKFKGLY
jgi:hypothetical protein